MKNLFFTQIKYRFNYICNQIFKEYFKKRIQLDWRLTTKRYDILNSIIKNQNYKNYLEIGCDQDATFNEVKIENKIGVDPKSGGTIRKTSDDFFKGNKLFFDIIFIDGLHIYEQVKKDINNALNFLKPSGVILLHDCLPLKIRDQMVPRSHDHWNGDTWKAIVEARTRNDLDTYTCEADHGIGIIFKRDNKQILKLDNTNFKSLKFKDYYYNYNNFMNPIKEKQITDLFQ